MSKLKVIKQAFDYFITTEDADSNFATVMPLAKYFARALWDCFDERALRKFAERPIDEHDFLTKAKTVLITLFGEDGEGFADELKAKYTNAREQLAFDIAFMIIPKGKATGSEREALINELLKPAQVVKASYLRDLVESVKYWQKEMEKDDAILDRVNENNYQKYQEAAENYEASKKNYETFTTLLEKFKKYLPEVVKYDKDGNIDADESYDGEMLLMSDYIIAPSVFRESGQFNINELKFSQKFVDHFKEILNAKGYHIDKAEVVARQIVIEMTNARKMAELFPSVEQENIFTAKKVEAKDPYQDNKDPYQDNFEQESLFDKLEQ